MTNSFSFSISTLIVFFSVKDKIHTALDQLREIKAHVESPCEEFVPLSVKENPLLELKQLLLMHTPSSVTDEARSRFTQLLHEALQGKIYTAPS